MTPDGSFAVPPNPTRVRFVVLILRFLPSRVTVFVVVVVTLTFALRLGIVMTTAGGVPSVRLTGTTAGGLTAPWRSTTTSDTATLPTAL